MSIYIYICSPPHELHFCLIVRCLTEWIADKPLFFICITQCFSYVRRIPSTKTKKNKIKSLLKKVVSKVVKATGKKKAKKSSAKTAKTKVVAKKKSAKAKVKAPVKAVAFFINS